MKVKKWSDKEVKNSNLIFKHKKSRTLTLFVSKKQIKYSIVIKKIDKKI
jgi:hypothetical protein